MKKIKTIIISLLIIISLTGCDILKKTISEFSGERDFTEETDIDKNNNENAGESNVSIPEESNYEESSIINSGNSNFNDWLKDTKKEKYVVTVIGMTTCPHCINYKPVIEEVLEDNNYNVEFYWFYSDKVSNEEYTKLTTTYDLKNYEGYVPYTFIIKNGKFINDNVGEMDINSTKAFLDDNIK